MMIVHANTTKKTTITEKKVSSFEKPVVSSAKSNSVSKIIKLNNSRNSTLVNVMSELKNQPLTSIRSVNSMSELSSMTEPTVSLCKLDTQQILSTKQKTVKEHSKCSIVQTTTNERAALNKLLSTCSTDKGSSEIPNALSNARQGMGSKEVSNI